MCPIVIACLCVVVVMPHSAALCNLPFAKRFKRNDPKLSECWRSIFEEAPRYLSDGIPEFGVPPIDPWKSPDNYFLNGTTYIVEHEYMEHSGTKNFQIIENTIVLPLNVIKLTLRFRQLDHACTIVANGTFLNYKLSSMKGCHEGKADVTIDIILRGKRVMKSGKEHIDFNNAFVKVDGKYTESKFYGMVAGTREDNILFSSIVEKGLDLLFPIYMNECVQKSLGIDIASAIKNVYSNCPLDVLHPM